MKMRPYCYLVPPISVFESFESTFDFLPLVLKTDFRRRIFVIEENIFALVGEKIWITMTENAPE